MQAYLRIASFGLLGAALIVAVVTARLMSDGKRRFQEAMQAAEAEDKDAAVAALEDAAKAYVPGSQYTARALRELSIMAKAAEMRGDIKRAKDIWEVVRRSILSTRHIFQPNETALVEAERQLTRLVREQYPEAARIDPAARPSDPLPFLSLLLFFSLALWIAGALILCIKPRRPMGEPLIPLRYAWAGCLGGLGMWLLAAWIA